MLRICCPSSDLICVEAGQFGEACLGENLAAWAREQLAVERWSLVELESLHGLAGEWGGDRSPCRHVETVSFERSAIAAISRSGIDGARCCPRTASSRRTRNARERVGVWYSTGHRTNSASRRQCQAE